MKTFAPESPIVSIEGQAWAEGEGRLELRDGLVGIEVVGKSRFRIYPSEALVERTDS